MSQDSTFRTIRVATGICLVCSLFVSTAAVVLQPRQEKNQKLDKIKNVLMAGHLDFSDSSPEAFFEEKVQRYLINLTTGERVAQAALAKLPPIEAFEDIETMMKDPRYCEPISVDEDMAGIKRRPKYLVVYRVEEQGVLQQVILPVFGKGLWSTLYGFVALKSDLQTVGGMTFYKHKETPGLGGEVDNAAWKASWRDKVARDENGHVTLQVIKGRVDPTGANAHHQIDGLSGATITTRGVDRLIKYWLGENGFGPYLKKLREDI